MTETVSNTTNALVTIPVDTNNLIHVNGEQCIRAFLRRATGEVSVGDIAEWVIDQATIARRVILDNRNEKETLNPPISLDEE